MIRFLFAPRLVLLSLVGLILTVVLWAPGPAAATPFTLPAQRLALDLSFNYDDAGSQWTVTGAHGPFPLGGHFSSSSLQLGVRYGILDSLEVQFHTSYKSVLYSATPIHLFAAPGLNLGPGTLTDQIYNFSGQDNGFGDLYAGLSYRPIERHVNFAIESEVKIPTGYRAPTGTLCAPLSPGAAQQAVLTMAGMPGANLLHPADVCSGATLGDGQVDLSLLLELGKYIPQTRTFFRVEGGMNFRFQGPGQQVLAAAKAGENIRDKVILYAGARVAYTVNQGDPIGTTINSTNPTAAPDQYPANLLEFDAASRDHSFVFFDAGLIVRVLPILELRANYARALWGINFPELNTVSVGLAVAAL